MLKQMFQLTLHVPIKMINDIMAYVSLQLILLLFPFVINCVRFHDRFYIGR